MATKLQLLRKEQNRRSRGRPRGRRLSEEALRMESETDLWKAWRSFPNEEN
jgi:hypothetical protein